MPSTLTWLDHDPAQRERMNRILLLFTERGTVDQLGFGGIRDAFADQLFPGTSTIQTRLRYFLFVPWMYRGLENSEVPSRRAGAVARDFELHLVAALRLTGEAGVMGGLVGESLKILPSAVYWGGLRAWGIRRFHGSRAVYHRALDSIYERRKLTRGAEPADPGDLLATWHPRLPDVPPNWPEAATLELRREEAEFLRGRILAEQPRSLLALLARGSVETDVSFPWQHPSYESFSAFHKLLLHHARLLSEAKHGAALMYNLMLAERKAWEEKVEHYRTKLESWRAEFDPMAVQSWDLEELWDLTLNQGHTITHQTRRFVEEWVGHLCQERPLTSRGGARSLIEMRERRLKGSRSKFHNARALEEWGGEAGLGRLDFRWPFVQSHLNDLYRGLVRS